MVQWKNDNSPLVVIEYDKHKIFCLIADMLQTITLVRLSLLVSFYELGKWKYVLAVLIPLKSKLTKCGPSTFISLTNQMSVFLIFEYILFMLSSQYLQTYKRGV